MQKRLLSSQYSSMYCRGIEERVAFWILPRRFRVAGAEFRSLSVELEFKVPISSGIPHSSRRISDTKAAFPDPTNKILPDFGCNKQNFPTFRDPDFFHRPIVTEL